MRKLASAVTTMALLCAATSSASAATAATLTAGQYSSVGIVASNNGNANCSSAGLAPNATVISVIKYPGGGSKGFTIYTVPFGGGLQLCGMFPAVPAGGLDGFTAAGKCALDTINGNVPAQKVNFAFTSTVDDAFSSVGTTTVTIPAANVVGGGCKATIDTTIIYTGR